MHFPLKSSRSHSAPGDPRGERAVLGVAFVAVRALGAQARFLPVGGVGTVASSTVRWRPGINRPGRWTHTGRRSAQGELACKMQGCGRGVSAVPSALPAAPISAGGGGSGSPPPGWNPQPGRGQRLLPTLATGWFTDTARPERPRHVGNVQQRPCCWREGSWVAPHP